MEGWQIELNDFWNTKEWEDISAKLDELEDNETEVCPSPGKLWAAMDEVPFDEVKVMIVGQDPYPDLKFATGIAFHTGGEITPTLFNIFAELQRDLHVGKIETGDLTPWTAQGVFLWNAIPTCIAGQSLSHYHLWGHSITKEIIKKLCDKANIGVFIFLGGVAREFVQYVEDISVIETSHPSPRASLNSRTPFKGSRIFSRCNELLVRQKLEPIDWDLSKRRG